MLKPSGCNVVQEEKGLCHWYRGFQGQYLWVILSLWKSFTSHALLITITAGLIYPVMTKYLIAMIDFNDAIRFATVVGVTSRAASLD